MKKTLTSTLALLAGAVAVHAQGSVSFANYLTGSYLYVSYKASPSATPVNIGGVPGTYPTPTMNNWAAEVGNGVAWTVQLWGAAGASATLTEANALETASLAQGGVNDNLAGTWVSTAVASIAGVANGGAATLELVAWYNAGGAITDFATAQADYVPTGTSATITANLGAPPAPPTALPVTALGNFSVMAVPEPSTIALGVIGASAFLVRLRRKN